MSEKMTADPARNDELILVDGLDRKIGTATKEKTHREGLLHRAFSVVLVRDGAAGPELLLAQRAECKYHSAGLWANSCCSHPRKDEELPDAVRRRVAEELGCGIDDLKEVTAFVYRAEFADGICEYEYDHVLIGRCAGELSPDPVEVGGVRWIGFEDLAAELADNPRSFAPWAYTVLTIAMNELRGE